MFNYEYLDESRNKSLKKDQYGQCKSLIIENVLRSNFLPSELLHSHYSLQK